MSDIIVFCDVADAAGVLKPFAPRVTLVPVPNGPGLAKAVRAEVQKRKGTGAAVFVNWCTGTAETPERASAAAVSALLEAAQVPYVGNPAAVCRYDDADLRMLMFYSEFPVVPFSFASSAADIDKVLGAMTPPLLLQPLGEATIAAPDADAIRLALGAALERTPSILVTEARYQPTHFYTIRKCDGKVVGLPTNVVAPTAMDTEALLAAVASTIMGKHGHCRVGAVHGAEPGTVLLASVEFQCLPLDTQDSLDEYLAVEVPAARARCEAVIPRHVVSFDAAAKGYFMRAARAIAAGEVVFHDEGRTFAVVTREHVAATWSEADKVTFSRYAWPLDCESHVYAIWEDDPKRWRPINHSCDPNLIFASKHSLNVVARRAIPAGEDLTMDYATFCDFTMKAFACFCRSAECRGLVEADTTSLAKYGTNAWHRRLPPQVSDLLPAAPAAPVSADPK